MARIASSVTIFSMAEEVDKKNLQTPQEHRLEEELRVCDPEKVDYTRDMESWRVFRIMAEMVEGFELIRKYRLAATFFGSARCSIEDDVYENARQLAGKLSNSGFSIITGGAGGVMQAANQGAFEAGGKSVGLNIQLPYEQVENKFLTESKTFNYFFTRKVMLAFASEVYIFFPGGFGTLDELFEILTLVQTKKIKRIPVILVGKEYWSPIIELIEKHLLEKFHTVDEEDTTLYTLVDSVEEGHKAVLDLVRC